MAQLFFLLIGSLCLSPNIYAGKPTVTPEQMALLYQYQEEGRVTPDPDIGGGQYKTLTDQIRALEAEKNGKEPKVIQVSDQEIDLNKSSLGESTPSETTQPPTLEQEVQALKKRVQELEEKPLKKPRLSTPTSDAKLDARAEATLEAEAEAPVLTLSSNAHKTYDEGLAMMQEGKYTQASEIFRELMNQYPEDPYHELAQIKIAECDMSEGNYKNALESFEKAYALNREHATRLSHIRLKQADICRRLDKTKEKEEYLKEVNPRDLSDEKQLELYNSLKQKAAN